MQKTSGQKILTKGRIAWGGANFSRVTM